MIEHIAGTPAGEKKKSYLNSGLVTNILTSIWVIKFSPSRYIQNALDGLIKLHCVQNGPLKNPSLIGKQGNISQLGGELIFGSSMWFAVPEAQQNSLRLLKDNECIFAYRMQHSEDRQYPCFYGAKRALTHFVDHQILKFLS
jgi:hypothetical protein